MVATKDVCMEPTIRSLQEDLVSGLTHQHRAAVSNFTRDLLFLIFKQCNSLKLHRF